MPDLKDGESVEMQGAGSKAHVPKNVDGVFRCSCPVWRNQSLAIERRTCKHLRKLRGDQMEDDRIGSTITFRYQELTDAGVPRFLSFVRVV